MTTPARIGRPPKVAREDIARAALDIGLDRANIRNVADALGMSATGLYHHVRTREQLVRLVAEFRNARMVEQAPKEGAFSDLLLYFAREFYELYADNPRMISDIYSGQVTLTAKVAPLHERVVADGVRSGFTPMESFEIYTCIIAAVIGAATLEASDRLLAREDSSFLAEVGGVLEPDRTDAPHLQALVVSSAGSKIDNFDKVHVMLAGLRAKYGDRLSQASA